MLRLHHSAQGTRDVQIVEVQRDLVISIAELEKRLAQAREFQRRFETGVLVPGDTYLSFGSVVENGYDRTGPAEETVVED